MAHEEVRERGRKRETETEKKREIDRERKKEEEERDKDRRLVYKPKKLIKSYIDTFFTKYITLIGDTSSNYLVTDHPHLCSPVNLVLHVWYTAETIVIRQYNVVIKVYD